MELIKKTVNSIWNTVESDAWSRNFTFAEYKLMCAQQNVAHVTEYAYKMIYQTLQAIMDNDPQMQPSDDSLEIIGGLEDFK